MSTEYYCSKMGCAREQILTRQGVYLNSRHFKGLEQRYGMDEPAPLEEGRSGIARGYGEEKE